MESTRCVVVIFIFSNIFLLCTKGESNYPVVDTEEGLVKGILMTSSEGRPFYAFKGIRYAKPPIGDLRFQPPQPADPWEGIWDATTYGSSCFQYYYLTEVEEDRVRGEEDCLFINVFTPKAALEEKALSSFDVLVFIHGGAFQFGSSSAYGTQYFMDRDIVLVTFNYRLGPLGFLSLEDEVLPGNYGLKDQVAALKWIQRNIATFGGNPNSVTVTGHSAGGASVELHYVSPMTEGLFHRGISFSGTALLHWAVAREKVSQMRAKQLADNLGCPTKCSHELVTCLRQRPGNQITAQVGKFLVWLFIPFIPFAPTVEKVGKNPFLPEDPYTLLSKGKVKPLPWITGVTTEEGLYGAGAIVTSATRLHELDQQFESIAPHILDYNFTATRTEMKMISEKIRKFYFGDKQINEETIPGVIKMMSDRNFILDAMFSAQTTAAICPAPVYFYQFSYRGKHSRTDVFTKPPRKFGVAHTDDINYILDVKVMEDIENEGPDKEVSKLLLDLWTGFAITGNPSAFRNFTWEPVTAEGDIEYLSIASKNDVKMKTGLLSKEKEFWESLPLKELGKSNVPARNFTKITGRIDL